MAHPAAQSRVSNQAPSGATLSPDPPTVNADAAANTDICTITPVDTSDSAWTFSEVTGNAKLQLSSANGATTKLQRSASGTITAGVNEAATVRITDRWGQYADAVVTIGVLAAGGGAVSPIIIDGVATITNAYAVDQLVATINPTNSPSPATCDWSITSQTTTGMFKIDASGTQGLLRIASTANLTAQIGTPQSVTVSVNNGGAADTAVYTVTIQDSTAETLLTIVTMENASASAKTDELVEFSLPLAASALGSSDAIRVYDDNGSGDKGSVLANFQAVNLSTDLNNARRWYRKVVGIVPSIDGSGGAKPVRQLHVYRSPTAAPTGTAIVASDLLATAFDLDVEYDIGGTIWTFDARAALAAGTTFSKTDYQCIVIASGPCWTELLLSGPPKNAGSAHAGGDGLRTFVSLRAWKKGTGAVTVGGANDILCVEFDFWTMNGDVARASPANYYYGLTVKRATSLSVGTLIATDDADQDGNVIRYAYARSQPSATLTAGGATTTGSKTGWSISAGSWANDIVGAHITDGTGYAYITSRTGATTINVYVYKAFAAASFTAGNWTIEGIGHPYAVTAPPLRGWVGTKPTNVAIWGSLASAITAESRAPMDYLASARLALNSGLTHASVSHSTVNIDLMRGVDGNRRPLTLVGPRPTKMGDLNTYIGTTGGGPPIGPMPSWSFEGFVKYTAAGRRKIRENAEYFSTWQYNVPPRYSGVPAAGELGAPPRQDGGVQYKWSSSASGTLIAVPATKWWPYDGDTAHHPAALYPHIMMTGDLWAIMALQRQEDYVTAVGPNSTYHGSGVNKTSYGDALGALTTHMGASQTRGKAWCTRDLLHATIATFDDMPEKVGTAKSYYRTRVAKHWQAAAAYGPNDALGYHLGTGAAPEWLRENGDIGGLAAISSSAKLEAPWQMSFNRIVAGMANELGLLDANGHTFWNWQIQGAVTMDLATATHVRDLLSRLYYVHLRDTVVFTVRPTSWDEIWKRSCLLAPISALEESYGKNRQPTGTVTLSNNTVGIGRTVVFSTDYFSNGGAWYVSGYVQHLDGGTFKITSVSGDGLTLTGDVVTAFAAAGAQTVSRIRIPGPHRLDYDDSDYSLVSVSSNYTQYYIAGCRLAKDAGKETAAMTAAIAYHAGRPGYTEADKQFNIQERA